MSIEEISNELNSLAYRLDSMRNYQATTEGLKTTNALRKAADMLQSNHNEKLNDPLTLDELREMEGEPVFLKRPGYCDRWALVKVSTETLNVYFILVDGIEDETFISAEIEIKNGCKVYRRKPEE